MRGISATRAVFLWRLPVQWPLPLELPFELSSRSWWSMSPRPKFLCLLVMCERTPLQVEIRETIWLWLPFNNQSSNQSINHPLTTSVANQSINKRLTCQDPCHQSWLHRRHCRPARRPHAPPWHPRPTTIGRTGQKCYPGPLLPRGNAFEVDQQPVPPCPSLSGIFLRRIRFAKKDGNSYIPPINHSSTPGPARKNGPLSPLLRRCAASSSWSCLTFARPSNRSRHPLPCVATTSIPNSKLQSKLSGIGKSLKNCK